MEIGADGTVILYTVTQVHVHLTLVVYPWHTEGQDTLGLHNALDNLGFLKLRVFVVDFLYRQQHFAHCLQIL